jgi:hypothetical protein
MKKSAAILFCLILMGIGLPNQTKAADTEGPQPSASFKSLEPFYNHILHEVAEQASALVYDYDQRPVIGTIIFDFHDSAGQNIRVGENLAAYLREGLNRERQFYVYGREQIQRSLGHFVQTQQEHKPFLSSRLQEVVPTVFKKPIHLIITGEITQTAEQQLWVAVTLIPFYRILTPVEREAEKIDYPRRAFISTPLPPQELKEALTVVKKPLTPDQPRTPGYGRLIILSGYQLEKSREKERRYLKNLEATDASLRPGSFAELKQVDLGDPEDLNCWLDKQELYIVEDQKMKDQKGYYHNILSGFGAQQIWFDGPIPEGPHQLAFSVFPENALAKKAVSYPFTLKPEVTTYLVVTVRSHLKLDPEVTIRMVIDPENKPFPF